MTPSRTPSPQPPAPDPEREIWQAAITTAEALAEDLRRAGRGAEASGAHQVATALRLKLRAQCPSPRSGMNNDLPYVPPTSSSSDVPLPPPPTATELRETFGAPSLERTRVGCPDCSATVWQGSDGRLYLSEAGGDLHPCSNDDVELDG